MPVPPRPRNDAWMLSNVVPYYTSRDQTRGQRQRHTSLDIFRGWAPADDRNCHYAARGDV